MPAGHKAKAGDTHYTDKGYVREKVIDDPEFGTGWISQHVLVYFRHTGYRPKKGEVVHHKDDIKDHNEFSNLELMAKPAHDSLSRKRGTPWNKGLRGAYSEEHIAKLRKATGEAVWTDERKAKVSASAKARTDQLRGEDGKFSLTNPKTKVSKGLLF